MAICIRLDYNIAMLKVQFIRFAVFYLFLLYGCAGMHKVTPVNVTEESARNELYSAISVPAGKEFYINRRFTYVIAWNNIPVGRIMAESLDMKEYRGRKAYEVKLVTESNDFLSKIYRVEDKYVSYIDAVTMTSLRYEADRKEGKYRKHVIVEYDFENMRAVYTNLTDGSVKECEIETNVQDPLSAMCFFMTMPVRLNENIRLTVNLNEKNYRLSARVEDFEALKVGDMGIFPAFKIRPYAELDGSRVNRGRAWIYFSADNNRYPLYGVVRIPFGTVTATLTEVTAL
ncbi:MAG: DUF3108 domain-containing protein [Candidatus Omnitrophota bacterium]